MSRWRRLRSRLLCLAALLLAARAAAAQGVLLVPRFEAGERVRYQMQLMVETKSSLIAAGQAPGDREPLRLSIDMTWQVEALEVEPTGSTRFRAEIEALELHSSLEDPRDPAQDFAGKSVTYRVGADGKAEILETPPEWLEEGQPPAWLRAWLEQSSGPAIGLPTRAIEPGETWTTTQEFEAPGLPRQRLVAENEYLRDEQAAGRPCAAVMTRFSLGGADRHQPEEIAGSNITIDRRVEGDGSRLSCYDHRNGRVLEASQESHEHIRIEIHAGTGETAEPARLESETRIESHLRVLD